eukprot:scaffold886_cov149-Isochrysis_galbana.AAC.2
MSFRLECGDRTSRRLPRRRLTGCAAGTGRWARSRNDLFAYCFCMRGGPMAGRTTCDVGGGASSHTRPPPTPRGGAG